MSIGENIKRLRIARGMTQDELAQRVGVSAPMISQIERGTKAVTLQLGKQIADTFMCTVDDLFNLSGNRAG